MFRRDDVRARLRCLADDRDPCDRRLPNGFRPSKSVRILRSAVRSNSGGIPSMIAALREEPRTQLHGGCRMCGCFTHRATASDLVDRANLMREPERTVLFSFAPRSQPKAQYDRRLHPYHAAVACPPELLRKTQGQRGSPDFQITKHCPARGRLVACRRVQR